MGHGLRRHGHRRPFGHRQLAADTQNRFTDAPASRGRPASRGDLCAPWGHRRRGLLTSDASDGILSLTWNPGFVVITQQLRILSGGQLEVTEHDHFVDNSERPDADYTWYYLKQ